MADGFTVGCRVRIVAECAGWLSWRIVGMTAVVLRASASGLALSMDSPDERETWMNPFVPRHAAGGCLERLHG